MQAVGMPTDWNPWAWGATWNGGIRGNSSVSDGRYGSCKRYNPVGGVSPTGGERIGEDIRMLKQAFVTSSVVLIAVAGRTALAGPVLDIDPELMGLPRGGIIVDQQPAPFGGSGSDTLGLDIFGQEIWQRAADNIVLDGAAIVGGINWWGFYGGEDQPHLPPSGDEIFRLRFYGARPNGLPAESMILYEESFLNPQRTWTGRRVLVQGEPNEYVYSVALSTPVSFAESELYWLEITQIGDIDSWFRWETGFGLVNQHAIINYLLTDWHMSSGSYAFQLVAVPEPGSAMLLLFGSSLALRCARSPRRSRARQAR